LGIATLIFDVLQFVLFGELKTVLENLFLLFESGKVVSPKSGGVKKYEE
jgi:hypothetical protein